MVFTLTQPNSVRCRLYGFGFKLDGMAKARRQMMAGRYRKR